MTVKASGGDSQRVQSQLHSVEQIQGVFLGKSRGVCTAVVLFFFQLANLLKKTGSQSLGRRSKDIIFCAEFF